MRLAASALALILLTACQQAPSGESTVSERRIAETLAKVETCAAEQCETLNIDRGLLEDFGIVALPHVRALRMSWTDFDDLADIAPMTQLEELHISDTQITDLSGLAGFTNLAMLHLQWSRNVTDFSPIGQLTGLTELALGGNDLGDMEFLAGLTQLEGLSLRGAVVGSFEVLTEHPTLSRLDIMNTILPADISPLLTLGALEKVSIKDGLVTPAQRAVLDVLKARGVQVEVIPNAVVVIC